MIPGKRKEFNQFWTDHRYQQFLHRLEVSLGLMPGFHICETPLFFPASLTARLRQAGEELVSQALSKEVHSRTGRSVPENWRVPGDEGIPHFIQVDFALTGDPADPEPRLIELQGFPTVYAFQTELARQYRQFAGFPGLHYLPDPETDDQDYFALLRQVIVGKEDPAETILLEIDPLQQKTYIDFYLTQKHTGISIVNVRDLIRRGNKYFYRRDGRETGIKRIYNRLIFDEYERKQVISQADFRTMDSVDWVTHPNWYYRISKFILPFLNHPSVPGAWFLHEAPADLDYRNYVLKPLFSFAGTGVLVDVTRQDIDRIPPDLRQDFILQEKVTYAPVLQTPDEPARAEIRVMFLWDGTRHRCVNMLARISKGKMMGVDFNKNKTWVGSSAILFETGSH